MDVVHHRLVVSIIARVTDNPQHRNNNGSFHNRLISLPVRSAYWCARRLNLFSQGATCQLSRIGGSIEERPIQSPVAEGFVT